MKLFSNALTLTLLGSATIAQAAQPSHYDILKDKYLNDTNDSITREELEGTYLGRCFDQSAPDAPDGMLLTTRKYTSTSTQNPDEGPDFPEVTTTTVTWKMSTIEANGKSPQANDSSTPGEVDTFWTNPKIYCENFGEYAVAISELKVSDGIATSIMTSPDLLAQHPDVKMFSESLQVKEGKDGYFYAHRNFRGSRSNKTLSFHQFCYFWKRLF